MTSLNVEESFFSNLLTHWMILCCYVSTTVLCTKSYITLGWPVTPLPTAEVRGRREEETLGARLPNWARARQFLSLESFLLDASLLNTYVCENCATQMVSYEWNEQFGTSCKVCSVDARLSSCKHDFFRHFSVKKTGLSLPAERLSC